MGAASGSATVPACERALSPAGSRDPECPKNALRDPKTKANLAPSLKNADCIQPPSGRAAPTALQLSANLQPPLRLPPSQTIDVAALHTPLPFNPASCKSRGPSVSVEEPAPELIASEDGGDPDNNARQLTPPLNPAPRTTRDSACMGATRSWVGLARRWPQVCGMRYNFGARPIHVPTRPLPAHGPASRGSMPRTPQPTCPTPS